MPHFQSLSSSLILLALFATAVRSDWPEIMGPFRNGMADSSCKLPDERIGELKFLWKIQAGEGYAGPAIAENDLILFERVGDFDRVRMVNANTGVEVWTRDLKATYRGGVNSDKGPRCVPSILENKVVVYSASGDLTVLDRKNGEMLWTRPLRKEFQAEDGYFGAGSTPLIVDDKIVVNVGGKSACVVCLSLSDGKTVWTANKGEASYASPIVLTSNLTLTKLKVVVVPARFSTSGINLATGAELWKFPFGLRGPTVNAATPIVTGEGNIFLTASYGIGSLTINPKMPSVEIVRKGEEISSQYASPISLNGCIYGSDGREDGGAGSFKCLRESDESLGWEQPNMPICYVIGVDQKLLLCGINGKLWCLNANNAKFDPVWETALPTGVYRAMPALSENKLFTRSSDGREDVWLCIDLN